MAYGTIMGQTPKINAENLQLNANQIVSGVLPVNRGGTGVTSYSSLKTQLGITDNGWKLLGQVSSVPNNLNNVLYLNDSINNQNELFVVWSASGTSSIVYLSLNNFSVEGSQPSNVMTLDKIKISGTVINGSVHLLYPKDNLFLATGINSGTYGDIIMGLYNCNNYTNSFKYSLSSLNNLYSFYLAIYGKQ